MIGTLFIKNDAMDALVVKKSRLVRVIAEHLGYLRYGLGVFSLGRGLKLAAV
jgi:hypothetical protein